MDENLKEKFVSAQRLYEGKVINLRRDMVLLPNGNQASREVVEHPGAVAVVPVLPDGRVLMVRQFRHPVGEILLEIPVGNYPRVKIPMIARCGNWKRRLAIWPENCNAWLRFLPRPVSRMK